MSIFFSPASYQLVKNKKWIPSATLFEETDNSLKITEEYQSSDRTILFDTREAADEFIQNFCQQQGFIKNTQEI
jgi:hypothetical protein